jgi:hypothetical protein
MAMTKADRDTLDRVATQWLEQRTVLCDAMEWTEEQAAALLAQLAKRGWELSRIPEDDAR